MNAPILRTYQSRATGEILAHLQRRAQGVLLEAPVGSGKTTMGMDVAATMLGAGRKIGWFTHRQELRGQAAERAALFDLPFGEIAPGMGLTSHPLHIASIDTVIARLPSLMPWLESLGLAIFDEAHHLPAAGWTRIADAMKRAQNLGLTATPYRLDGKGLGETGHFDRIVRCPDIAALTQAGYLAPAIVYAPPTSLDMSSVKKLGGDYSLKHMAAAVEEAKLSIIGRRWYAKHAPGQPAIVFCPTVELAEASAAAYRAAGWRATSVDGSMSDRDRNAAVGGLADGSVQILCSCSIVSEGFDCPAVSVCILERPTASTGLLIQMIGRCLRPHDDKTNATVVDLVGNSGRHGMYDSARQWDLQGGIKGIERAVAGTWRCRKCYRVQSRPEGSAQMVCSCGNSQKVSGFASAKVENHPPIAGIKAETLLAMKFKDAISNLKTQSDLVAYGKLREMQHPVAWAKRVIEERMPARRYRRAW